VSGSAAVAVVTIPDVLKGSLELDSLQRILEGLGDTKTPLFNDDCVRLILLAQHPSITADTISTYLKPLQAFAQTENAIVALDHALMSIKDVYSSRVLDVAAEAVAYS